VLAKEIYSSLSPKHPQNPLEKSCSQLTEAQVHVFSIKNKGLNLRRVFNPLKPISFPGFQEIFYFPTFSQCVVKLLTPAAYILFKMINKTLINKFSSN
jgi:hypothetical protein